VRPRLGHAADLDRLDLWETLRDVLRTAAELGLIPVSNGEGFSRLTGPARIDIREAAHLCAASKMKVVRP